MNVQQFKRELQLLLEADSLGLDSGIVAYITLLLADINPVSGVRQLSPFSFVAKSDDSEVCLAIRPMALTIQERDKLLLFFKLDIHSWHQRAAMPLSSQFIDDIFLPSFKERLLFLKEKNPSLIEKYKVDSSNPSQGKVSSLSMFSSELPEKEHYLSGLEKVCF